VTDTLGFDIISSRYLRATAVWRRPYSPGGDDEGLLVFC
jgi:hypothetical protein